MDGMTNPFAPWPLPDASNWRFSEIRKEYPEQADRLETMAGRDALRDALVDALSAAVSFTVILAWEFTEERNTDHRAHYRAHPQAGHGFNSMLIAALCGVLERHLPATLDMPRVDIHMAAHGNISVSRNDFVRSFDLRLSKLWWGVHPVDREPRHIAVSGPKTLVGSTEWVAPFMQDPWLDLKGAFSDNGRLYQTKDPNKRAQKLHEKGQA